MKEGYKKTELGWIPEEWSVVHINEISQLITKGTTPSTYGFDFEDEGINFIKIENLFGRGKIDINNILKISEQCNNLLKRSQIKSGDILFSIAGTLGKTIIINDDILPCNTNQALSIIRLKDNVNKEYINEFLKSDFVKTYINKISTVGAQPNISLKQVGDIKVILPIKDEQEKIAEILSTVDSQIDYTDELIEKTKELKKGLMQTLLTRGIGHSEFKKSEVGEIPVEWEVKEIGEIINLLKSGLSRSLKDENIGIPCLRSNNIKDNRLNLDDLKYWYLNDDKGANITEYILDQGDILVNFINSLSQIGKTCIFNRRDFKTIYTTNLLRIKIDSTKTINKYFYYFTQTSNYMKQVDMITKPAVNQASFTTVEYKQIKLPIPNLHEQQEIVDILSSVDLQIDEYENKKAKLEELKKGLMQKLLTGEIRVKY